MGAMAAVCVGLSVALSGCATPMLESRVDATAEQSPCESAYIAATAASRAMNDAPHAIERYLSAREAASGWKDVALDCPQRIDEGVLRSAQAAYRSMWLARRAGAASPSPIDVDYGEVVKLTASSDALDDMALAEDRAGFAVGVLAARDADGATLGMADNHKTVAQRLVTLSGSDQDPRRKVYAVDALIGDAHRASDPATGLSVPTLAVVEMDCAREELAAIRDEGDITPRSLDVIVQNIVSRFWRAFDLGYPATDANLFAEAER